MNKCTAARKNVLRNEIVVRIVKVNLQQCNGREWSHCRKKDILMKEDCMKEQMNDEQMNAIWMSRWMQYEWADECNMNEWNMFYWISRNVWEVIHVSGDAGEHGGGSDERVIEGDDRRQVGDLKRIRIGCFIKYLEIKSIELNRLAFLWWSVISCQSD